MKRFAMIAAACAVVCGAVPAEAVTTTLNGAIDPTQYTAFDEYYAQGRSEIYYSPFAPGTEIILSSGDTIQGVIDVYGQSPLNVQDGGSVRGTNAEYLGLNFSSDDGIFGYTSSLSLGGITGEYTGPAQFNNSYNADPSSPNSGIGARAGANLTDTSFGIRQITYSVTLNSGGPVRLYYPSFIIYDQPTPAVPVPEPSTWAMLVAGFGAVGCAVRRRARGALLSACCALSAAPYQST